MAREKGTFNVSANYEPLKAAPFDARSLVKTKADLTNIATWTINNDIWIYDGMLVTVMQDSNPKFNGVYRLVDAENFNFDSSWMKLANDEELDAIKTDASNKAAIVLSESQKYTDNEIIEASIAIAANVEATYRKKDAKIISDDFSDDEVFIFNCGTASTVI